MLQCAADELIRSTYHLTRRVSATTTECAFPYHEYAPTGRNERVYRLAIPSGVSFKLLLPEVPPSRRERREVTTVRVPKAAVNKHDNSVLR